MRLVPEPESPHDREAVRVEIDGEHVGYIPRGKRRSHTVKIRAQFHVVLQPCCLVTVTSGITRN